jgi:ADP-ribose pyrophosphatase
MPPRSQASGPSWARLRKQVLFTTPYDWKLSHDRYRLPGGAVGDYYYLDVAGSVMLVPELDDGRLVLVKQFRYLIGKESLELPAGGLDWGEEPEAGARRELAEETGYRASELVKIGEIAPYNGVSNELCHVFVARGLEASAPQPDATEAIDVLRLSKRAVFRYARDGRLWDGMSLAALFAYERWSER